MIELLFCTSSAVEKSVADFPFVIVCNECPSATMATFLPISLSPFSAENLPLLVGLSSSGGGVFGTRGGPF